MSLLSSIGKTLYKGATTKVGAAAIIGGAATAGLAKNSAPAARDAAMDVAFGDPNADESFLGRKLTPGAVFDAAVPAPLRGSRRRQHAVHDWLLQQHFVDAVD